MFKYLSLLTYLKAHKHLFLQLMMFITLISLVTLIYFQGNTGSFYYDDYRPFGNLANITDLNSTFIYLTTEISGTLGRPISMLSFLFNIDDWPNNSTGFLNINIFIHCANGIFIFFLTYLISALLLNNKGEDNNRKLAFLALSTSFFWLILPIHVSTSLIAIQRMAGLSAFFVFAGLVSYVYGLRKQQQNPSVKNSGLAHQLTGIFVFTLLAMFTKENGILLPIFILVLETTLFINVAGIEYRRKLRVRACSLGLIVILSYLVFSVIKYQNIYPNRDFTLTERLITQPQILLQYIKLAFIPDVSAFNPFHDNYQFITDLKSNPWAIFSIIFWMLSLVCSLVYRKRFPIVSFAILWFLAAHILESSVLNLELYFEHRNYVALFGPCFAIILGIFYTPEKYKNLLIGSFSLYILLLLFLLFQTTTLWGQPQQAAETWFMEQSGSPRATEHLTIMYLEQNRLSEALSILEHQVKLCPDCISSSLQALLVSCISNHKKLTKEYYEKSLQLSLRESLTKNPSIVLAALFRQIKSKNCSLISLNELKYLNESFLSRKIARVDTKIALLVNLQQIAIEQNNNTDNLKLLWSIWDLKQDKNLGGVLVTNLLDNNLLVDAEHFAKNEMCQTLSSNPLVAENELQQCESTVKRIEKFIKEKGE